MNNPVEHDLSFIFAPSQFTAKIQQIREPLHLIKNDEDGSIGLMTHSEYQTWQTILTKYTLSHVGVLPALYPENLGDPTFRLTHHCRFPYIVGEMANGIATSEMVIAAAKAGMLGFFGAAGLLPAVIEKNILAIQAALGTQYLNWGANLINSPHEPHIETATVDLYLQHHVNRVSASAYMSLTPEIIRYACHGLTVDPTGRIARRNYVFAKISRPEVAKPFLSPAPEEILNHLVQQQKITAEEAQLARFIPVAEDITVEADSGGHTDNRPLTALFPTILMQAQALKQQYQYSMPLRIGAAGGLGTPAAVNAAFNLGAAYVLTGTINQSAVEAGLSEAGKHLLASADIADVAMAAAADMFELGVKLQVLKRGTLFAARANKLYEIYTSYGSLPDIPLAEKTKLEQQIFGNTLEEIWAITKQFFQERDRQQLEKAEASPKHKMALVFRWYLGLSSRWAIAGTEERKSDYQIWCGPAMGAFNRWVADSFLENIAERTVE